MAHKPVKGDPETLRRELINLLEHFEEHLKSADLRRQVKQLIPAHHHLRDLGSSLMTGPDTESGRDRILAYVRKFAKLVLDGEELMVVAGIDDYARRIRELRVQFGWPIMSGMTIRDISQDEPEAVEGYVGMKPDEYLLIEDKQDRDAAHRWNVANEIRKKDDSVQSKVLEYLKANVGKGVTGEELRYVANDKSEWARRVRELRTEEGWRISTKTTGRPDLPVGTYVLESDVQSEPHDRNIDDAERREVLMRDAHRCQDCGWHHGLWNPSDPRHLEVHHLKPHAEGGENVAGNLITLCNICHDKRHRRGERG